MDDETGHGHPHRVPVSRPDVAGGLHAVLERSRELGFLGPGPIDSHVRHAAAFLPGLDDLPLPSGRRIVVVDLGSGGGVPGLALAVQRPQLDLILVDAAERRTDFLSWAVEELGLSDRVTVERGRAEELARSPHLRGSADAVTARSFGAPAVTAECAVGFLRGPGAVLLVSEPPEVDPTRWPAEPLSRMGLRPSVSWSRDGASVQALQVIAACPDGLPRRVGVPARRPAY